jgi:Putative Actinobacterial Holin-X, holin superfamily III
MAGAAAGQVEQGEDRIAVGPAEDAGPMDGLVGEVAGWLSATRERARSISELAAAEAKLAAQSVALMAFLGMLTAVCLLGSWGMLLAGLVYALHQAGFPLWGALFVVGLANGVAAYLLWRAALGLSRHLEFSATRAELRHDGEAR